jgi:23S rRNA-/tRNA-specific pseudouridylate synthase
VALGQQLELVLAGGLHSSKDAGHELFRYVLMKEIAHRIDEDTTGTLPGERERETFGP